MGGDFTGRRVFVTGATIPPFVSLSKYLRRLTQALRNPRKLAAAARPVRAPQQPIARVATRDLNRMVQRCG